MGLALGVIARLGEQLVWRHAHLYNILLLVNANCALGACLATGLLLCALILGVRSVWITPVARLALKGVAI